MHLKYLAGVTAVAKTIKLEREIRTYKRNRKKLLRQHEGEFVLIKGKKIVGTYPREVDAIDAAYERFGYTTFFVRKITAVDEAISIYAIVMSC